MALRASSALILCPFFCSAATLKRQGKTTRKGNMPKLIYMRIRAAFPEPLFELVSYASGYGKRGLVYTTPHKDDVLLLDSYAGMPHNDPVELTHLNDIGLGPKPENVKIVNFDKEWSWEKNYALNKNVIDWLQAKKLSALLAFTGKSVVCHKLAKALSIPITVPDPKIAMWGESKQTLQELNKKYHLSPRGFICMTNKEIIEKWHRLCQLECYIVINTRGERI